MEIRKKLINIGEFCLMGSSLTKVGSHWREWLMRNRCSYLLLLLFLHLHLHLPHLIMLSGTLEERRLRTVVILVLKVMKVMKMMKVMKVIKVMKMKTTLLLLLVMSRYLYLPHLILIGMLEERMQAVVILVMEVMKVKTPLLLLKVIETILLLLVIRLHLLHIMLVRMIVE